MERNDVVKVLTDIAESNFGDTDIMSCKGDLIEAGFDSMNIINYILNYWLGYLSPTFIKWKENKMFENKKIFIK